MRFAKYHGLGNDFVVVDARAGGVLISSAAAVRICDRHRGVGADGVLTLLKSTEADFRMHIWNADGSEAEMCGNGLRCAVAFSGLERARVETAAGLREGWRAGGGRVTVTLGAAAIGPGPIHVEAAGEVVEGLAVSVGNPHFVLRPPPEGTDLHARAARLGPIIERARPFPRRTNVELFSIRGGGGSGGAIDLVVFERGVGITQACGTGAGATVAAAIAWGLHDPRRPARVHLPGGELEVAVDPEGQVIRISGDAVHVFDGEAGLDLSSARGDER